MSLHLPKCHIAGNHMSRLILFYIASVELCVLVLKGPRESPVSGFIVSGPSCFILDQIHCTLKLNTRNVLVIGKQLSLLCLKNV